jgi:hypothetical protein
VCACCLTICCKIRTRKPLDGVHTRIPLDGEDWSFRFGDRSKLSMDSRLSSERSMWRLGAFDGEDRSFRWSFRSVRWRGSELSMELSERSKGLSWSPRLSWSPGLSKRSIDSFDVGARSVRRSVRSVRFEGLEEGFKARVLVGWLLTVWLSVIRRSGSGLSMEWRLGVFRGGLGAFDGGARRVGNGVCFGRCCSLLVVGRCSCRGVISHTLRQTHAPHTRAHTHPVVCSSQLKN